LKLSKKSGYENFPKLFGLFGDWKQQNKCGTWLWNHHQQFRIESKDIVELLKLTLFLGLG